MGAERKSGTSALGGRAEEICKEERTENTREKMRKLEDYSTRYNTRLTGVKERNRGNREKKFSKTEGREFHIGKPISDCINFLFLCINFPGSQRLRQNSKRAPSLPAAPPNPQDVYICGSILSEFIQLVTRLGPAPMPVHLATVLHCPTLQSSCKHCFVHLQPSSHYPFFMPLFCMDSQILIKSSF